MKKIILVCFTLVCLLGKAQITTVIPGQTAPVFNLKNVNNKEISFASFPDAKGFIVVFTCNRCPVAQAYEQRIIELNNLYAPKGVPVIAINPNDPSVSPGDSFEEMKIRAKDKNYSFPYLYDEGQKITNAYGARNTPHIFLIKRSKDGISVVYTGAIDNDPENTNTVKVNYLQNAITAILNNKNPDITTTKAIGCTVKRKK